MDDSRARRILDRLPRSRIIEVDDYQNIFGRGRQDFWKQKASTKLILARKKDNLLYPGNSFLQSSASPNFCYNALVLNCPYDCHYCYLQGMYGSANIVAFINLEDYFRAAENFIRDRPDPMSPVLLAISYDSDLLALEGVLGYVGEWVNWSRSVENVIVEVRTKSAGKRFFEENAPSRQMRIAWTLSPDEICRRYESGAPSLNKRLEAMHTAIQKGWRVSICVDPVLRVPGWREIYGKFCSELEESLPQEVVERLEVGVFRVSPGYFRRMQKRPGTDLLHYPYEHANNAVSYNTAEKDELVEFLQERLSRTISDDKIQIWT